MPDNRLANAIRMLSKQTADASKPMTRVFGVVTKLDPLTIQVNEKLVLDEDFLVITQTVKNYINWDFLRVGDKVVMTRQSGGQLFIVDDMLACDKDFGQMIVQKHKHDYNNSTTSVGKKVE